MELTARPGRLLSLGTEVAIVMEGMAGPSIYGLLASIIAVSKGWVLFHARGGSSDDHLLLAPCTAAKISCFRHFKAKYWPDAWLEAFLPERDEEADTASIPAPHTRHLSDSGSNQHWASQDSSDAESSMSDESHSTAVRAEGVWRRDDEHWERLWRMAERLRAQNEPENASPWTADGVLLIRAEFAA